MRVFARAYLCGKGLRPEEMKSRISTLNAGSIVQTARGDSARNELFVEMLAAQTLNAETSGSLLARKPEIDLLLRLAGTTQIARAIEERGAKEGKPFLLMVADRRAVRPPSELSRMELTRQSLSHEELDRVERAALLNVQRT